MNQARARSLMLVLVAAGCVNPPDEGEVAAELDTTAPGLPGVGNPFAAAPMFWNWSDPGAPGIECLGCTTTPRVSLATEASPIQHGATLAAYAGALPSWPSAPLPTPFTQAAAAGDAVLADPVHSAHVSNRLQAIHDDLQLINSATGGLGEVVLLEPVTEPWVRGFPPVRGRHLEADFVRVAGIDRLQLHAMPAAFAELRMRGAKSYCALRSAADRMTAVGEDAYKLQPDDIDDNVLLWDIGATGARLKLLSSRKFTADAGAEAFMLPFLLSSRISPISGPVLPSFGELAHPLVWLSADRERSSLEDFGPLRPGVCITTPFGEVCLAFNTFAFRQTFRNLEHDDAIAGVSYRRSLRISNIQLINWGMFSVKAGGLITVETGIPNDHDPSPPAAAEFEFAEAVADGRVEASTIFAALVARSTVLDLPLPTTAPGLDAPLGLHGPSDFIAVGGPLAGAIATKTLATATRWKQNDDRAITVTDKIHEEIGLDAAIGFELGPVHVEVTGNSTLTLDTRQDVVLREQLSLAKKAAALPPLLGGDGHFAQTNLVAVPHSYSHYDLHPLAVALDFKVTIPTPFGDIDLEWHQPFFTLPTIPLGDDENTGNEQERLRVGEYSDEGGPGAGLPDGKSQKPKVVSYLPGGRLFQAFTTTVATCLADPTDPLDPPGPDGHTPTPGPVQANVCAVGPGTYDPNQADVPLPDGLCGDPANPDDHAVRDAYALAAGQRWSASTGVTDPLWVGDVQSCMSRVVDFVCRPTSVLITPSTRSHVMVANTTVERDIYGRLMKDCTIAFARGGSDKPSAKFLAEHIGETLLPLRSCSADGVPDPL